MPLHESIQGIFWAILPQPKAGAPPLGLLMVSTVKTVCQHFIQDKANVLKAFTNKQETYVSLKQTQFLLMQKS